MGEGVFAKFQEMASCAWGLGQTPRQKVAILWRQTKNLRVRLGVARYYPEKVFRVDTRYGPVFLRDNFGDVTNLPDLLQRNVYRLGRLEHDGAILDIGANIGLFAAWASWQNPGRVIHCFEPLESNARMIPHNCPAAVVHNHGVGSSRAVVNLCVDEQGVMASTIPTPWPTRESSFEVVPLDEFTEQAALTQIAFMKIDTEGMELEVLNGARRTLERTLQIAMETHGDERHRESIHNLQDAGFRIDDQIFSGMTGLVFASRS